MKRLYFSLLLSAAFLITARGASAEGTDGATPLKVVATLSTFADIAKTIGGAHLVVSTVAPPQFDPHFIEPRPSDVLRVKRADLFIHGGLDLEAWRAPLLDAVGRPELRPGGDRSLDVSAGIELLNPPASLSRSGGDIHQFGNPHYWLAPENGERIAFIITEKLRKLDPAHDLAYAQNYDHFREALQHAVAGIQERHRGVRGARIVAYHDSWPYFARFMGVTIAHFIESKPGVSPTPRHLEELERAIRNESIRVIVQESFYPRDAADHLASATGAKVVELCQNVGERDECKSYLDLVSYNSAALANGLSEE